MKLTIEILVALFLVENGADIYSREVAKSLREVEQKFPSLVIITKAKNPPPGKERQPFFGAFLTDKGKQFLRDCEKVLVNHFEKNYK